MEKVTGCASNALKRFEMQAALRIDMDDPSVLVMTRQERQTVMPGEGDPFMDYGIVKDIMEEEGSDGLGLAIALLLHLCQRKDGIARLSSVRTLAYQLRTGYLYTCHIIEDYELFRLTEDGLSYYSPYLYKTTDVEGMGVAWILDLSTSEEGRDN